MLNMHFIISVYGMMATKTHNSTSKVHIIIPPPQKAELQHQTAILCTIL